MEFALQTSGLYEDVLEAARFSERRGLPAIALPDHYLMSLDEDAAKTLVTNGCIAVGEGANMPTTPEGIKVFIEAKIAYGPGKTGSLSLHLH